MNGVGVRAMHSLSDISCVPFMDKQRTEQIFLCLQKYLEILEMCCCVFRGTSDARLTSLDVIKNSESLIKNPV